MDTPTGYLMLPSDNLNLVAQWIQQKQCSYASTFMGWWPWPNISEARSQCGGVKKGGAHPPHLPNSDATPALAIYIYIYARTGYMFFLDNQ